MTRVLAVAGTRPEAIKLAPVIRALRRRGVVIELCATGQQRELLADALRALRLRPDHLLRLMRVGQTPHLVFARARRAVRALLGRRRFALVLVQGDTSSAWGAAAGARDSGVPVAHVEAGLRSGDDSQPWPEELNRKRIDAVSALRFAPTPLARRNLLREGAAAASVWMTGNTGIDALLSALRRLSSPSRRRRRSLVIVTLHRRETLGAPLAALFDALARVAADFPAIEWLVPLHPNPCVRRAARRLDGTAVRVIEPPAYPDFVRLLRRAEFLVTDSGGIQEEAAELRKPVVVVRRKTERPELLGRFGTLAGIDPARVERLLRAWAGGRRPRARGKNPFGDGRAAPRIAAAIERWLQRAAPR